MMCGTIRFIYIIWFISFVHCKLKLDLKYVREEKKLNVCLLKILTQTNNMEPIKDVTAVNFNKPHQLAVLHEMKKFRIVSRSFFVINNTIYNQLYITNNQDYEEFKKGIKLLTKDYYWNPRAKFIVIIENMGNHIPEVSKELLENNIFNVTALIKVANSYKIYTFNTRLDACGKPARETLEPLITCSKLSRTTTFFNIPTPNTLQGCRIKMVTHNYWPFVNFNKTQRISKGIFQIIHESWNEVEGVETELKRFYRNEDFGRVLDNYTFTGMLSWIQERKFEGALGGYSVTIGRSKALDFTYPYQLDHNKVIILRAPWLSNWRTVYAQFTWGASVIIGTFIVFFSIFVAHFSVFEATKKDVGRNVLIVFGYLCSNMRTKYIKPDHSLRIVVCSLLLFVFFMSFSIQAFLLSATSNPIRGHQVTQLKEVFSTFTPVKSWSWQTVFSLKAPLDCRSMLDCLSMVRDSKNQNLYTVISEIPFMTVSWMFNDDYGESELYDLEEPANILYPTVFFRRGSTVLESYNKLLDRCYSSGLARKYFGDILFLDRLKSAQVNYEHNPENLNNLFEIFMILQAGYLLAVIAFIYECRMKIKLKLLPIIERFLEG